MIISAACGREIGERNVEALWTWWKPSSSARRSHIRYGLRQPTCRFGMDIVLRSDKPWVD